MNFTRDPVIETIITPKDGYKLLVRSSSRPSEDEYSVDALEVISFGKSMFYRCLEKPRAFLLPVSDYEVIETKETRVVLKKASIEKSIKIAGGRKPSKETIAKAEAQAEEQEPSKEEAAIEEQSKKRRRIRRRRSANEEKNSKQKEGKKSQPKEKNEVKEAQETAEKNEETPKAEFKPAVLIPPPENLISDHISRYKEQTHPPKVEEAEQKPSEPDMPPQTKEDPFDQGLTGLTIEEEKAAEEIGQMLVENESEENAATEAPIDREGFSLEDYHEETRKPLEDPLKITPEEDFDLSEKNSNEEKESIAHKHSEDDQ